MLIKGQEVSLTGANLIRALLRDEFGYKHTCDCGAEQTFDSLKAMLKKGEPIETDYKCKLCKMNKPCTVWGTTYKSVKEATEMTYNPDVCKCEKCGTPFTKDQWYQWCQRYLDENNGHLICHSCKSSDVRILLNEQYHDDISQQTRDRNLKNWQDPEYREKHAQITAEWSSRLWQSEERKYGEFKNQTFAEAHSIMARKEMKAEGGGLWSKPEYWSEMFLTRTRFATDNSLSDDQKFHLILDEVDALYNKYLPRYQNITVSDQNLVERNIQMKSVLDSYGLQSHIYYKYVMPILSAKTGHHVIPRSIHTCDDFIISVDPQEHIYAHLFLFLDNFTRTLNDNMKKEKNFVLTKVQIQVFMALFFLASHSLKKARNSELVADIERILKLKKR